MRHCFSLVTCPLEPELPHYSVEHRGRIFEKGYRVLPVAKIYKQNISKNVSGKHSQKHLDHGKQSAVDTLKIHFDCVIYKGDRATNFATTDPKVYVPVVTLPIQGNGKLIKQLKLGLKGTIDWNKYQ